LVDTPQIEAIASLEEPNRRRLYEYVAAAAHAVSRDEAAEATSIQRALAAFHLDRLAEQGLLVVEYRRLTGRTGRGAGRPSKLYRRADRSFDVQLPRRQYQLAAELMVEAIEAAGPAAHEALVAVARRHAAELGAADGPAPGSEAGPGSAAEAAVVMHALGSMGFEPRMDEAGEVRLANCPYVALVPEHRQTTCSMNLAFIEGLLEGKAVESCKARLDPQPGCCCVALQCGSARA
jgi:predicted ArsR family transcriptional regulator